MPNRVKTLRPRQAASVAQLRRDADDRRRERHPWRALYKTGRWAAIRAAQLRGDPLCRMCAADGIVTVATVCDHIEPHRGDEVKFFAGPFQSLCKWCHDSRKQKAERIA